MWPYWMKCITGDELCKFKATSSSLCLLDVYSSRDELSACYSSLHACYLHAMMDSYPSGPGSLNNLFYELLGHGVFSQ